MYFILYLNKNHISSSISSPGFSKNKNRLSSANQLVICNKIIFVFSFQNLEYEYIREDLGYGTIDLLCDVGGTLSLLMGASLLTCCELLEVAWIMLVKKCFRKVSKGISNTKRRHSRQKNSRKSRQQHTSSSSNINDPDVPPLHSEFEKIPSLL